MLCYIKKPEVQLGLIPMIILHTWKPEKCQLLQKLFFKPSIKNN